MAGNFPVYRKQAQLEEFEWMSRTPGPACAGILSDGDAKDEDFFPTKESDTSWHNTRLEFCAKCPVKSECLLFGMKNCYTGLWGGWILDGKGNRVHRPFGRRPRKCKRRSNGSIIMEEAS